MTEIAPSYPSQARDFALRGLAWGIGLFGLLRLPWFEAHAVLPLTLLQARVAVSGFGTPAGPIEITLACSGAEAFALCAAAILAYPALWPMRLGGAAGGILLILALNTLRIGTLGLAATSPWFDTLHLHVWPALLTLAIAGYVFTWIRIADRPPALAAARPRPASPGAREGTPITRRFVLTTALFLAVFLAASPLYLESAGVLDVAALVARWAAAALRLFGIPASAAANVLTTPRGAFLVSQECISTPLIPVYFAAIFAYAHTWRFRAVASLAAIPLFFGLGIARLLVVALPASLVGSPLFLIHAFHQLLVAGVVVLLAAVWRHGAGGLAWRRAILGGALGGTFVYLLGPPYTSALASSLATLEDPQGAIALLPAFQVGFFIALVVAAFAAFTWRPFVAGLGLLGLSQVALLAALDVGARRGLTPHVRDVRAWALAGPLLAVWALVTLDRPQGAAYRRFWAGVGAQFPDLGGAASTRLYADNERRLFREHLPDLAGLRVFKTDLWDEAKNTRILAWASQEGAHAYGVDISEPTVAQARTAFDRDALRGAVSDVRDLPFRDASFDAIYSMGTIEHFDETERAVEEMARVLKPGGRAIVGVPNRHDPFLRPLLASALQTLGLYSYGYEKSYSRRDFRQLLERAGFTVVAETGILFIPGWLRMLDLACHSWCRPLASLTGACVWPFVVLDRHVPAVRRHGYLLATVVTKPAHRP